MANAGTLKHGDPVRQSVAQKRQLITVLLHHFAFLDTNCRFWSLIWAVVYKMDVDFFLSRFAARYRCVGNFDRCQNSEREFYLQTGSGWRSNQWQACIQA